MESRRQHPIDKPLAIMLALLVVGGSLIFCSAAFGLIARGTTGMTSVVFNHLVLGVGVGLVFLFIGSRIDYHRWRKYSPYLFAAALVLTALVFVPHIGAEHGGGKRWLIVAHLSIQPSETLKVASVMLASAYFASIKGKVATLRYGLGGFLAILALPAALLVLQPDLGTLGVIVIGVGSIFVVAGARFRDIAAVLCLGLLALSVLFVIKPYVRDRVMTFFDPSRGQQAEGYQIKQSLIAIGSGQLLGRGFGQGVQKFTYLPEPMGDSIFAVAGEELGLVGTIMLVGLFLGLALRGLAVSVRADAFGMYLGTGISCYLASEAFINIASMLGVAPLTGIPLTFVSQGGSAILISLASAGILLNISRSKRGA